MVRAPSCTSAEACVEVWPNECSTSGVEQVCSAKSDLRDDVCSADAARPIIFLLMYCDSPLACSLIRAHPKRGVCIRVRKGTGEEIGGRGLVPQYFSARHYNRCFSDG